MNLFFYIGKNNTHLILNKQVRSKHALTNKLDQNHIIDCVIYFISQMSKEEVKITPLLSLTTDEMYILYLCTKNIDSNIRAPLITLPKFNTHCVQTLALVKKSNLNQYLAGHEVFHQRKNERDYFFLKTNNTVRVDINDYKDFNKFHLIELITLIINCLEFAKKYHKIPNIVSSFLESNGIKSKGNDTLFPELINITYEINEIIDENNQNLIENSQPIIKLEKPYELINLIGGERDQSIIIELKLALIKFAEKNDLKIDNHFLQKIDDFGTQFPSYI